MKLFRKKTFHIFIGGERLRLARVSRDITMKELAEGAGCSPAMICHLETGRKSASVLLAKRIEKYIFSKRRLGSKNSLRDNGGKK